MKKLLILALALVALATVGLTFGQGHHHPTPHPTPPPCCPQYRAGITGFQIGQDGIFITFSTPFPLGTVYAVHVQQFNTGGYSPTSDCTYFNPLQLTPSGFAVQHKTCRDGIPVPVDVNVSFAYAAYVIN